MPSPDRPEVAVAAGGALDSRLPARRLAADGKAHVDYGAIGALAWPLMLNSSLQAAINLTDTWFVGHISTAAMAGMAAIFWLVFFFVMLLGGIGLAVQTFAAQYEGGRRRWRAGHATWVALWGAVATLPVFAVIGWGGDLLLAPFGLDPEVERNALAFWQPRMLGAPLGVGLWALLGFFNGVSRPRITVLVTLIVGVVNAILNEVFIFRLGWGIAGSAWATNVSMGIGLGVALAIFLRADLRRAYRTHLTWRPDLASLWRDLRLGLPMGAMYAADLFGMALFSLMQVRLGQVDGATTQIVVMLTSIAYLPGVGLALAGTTLVGQAIGAGDRDWARRLGNTVIAITMGYMGSVGVLLALLGPWVMPLFVDAGDPEAGAVIRLGLVLLWIAAGYQLFDGLQLASGFALRGAGDVRVPAVIFLVLSWGVFVPLAHVLSFAPGQGWIDVLPQLGYGAVGGWFAMLAYVLLLAAALSVRWRSGSWRRLRI
ncbi:MAG TPA: MATE family efflux transporter [Steroidobacteraceae bacterium]|nr:MATE family efflux transporter [Steroidobacteraceae bacterium]